MTEPQNEPIAPTAIQRAFKNHSVFALASTPARMARVKGLMAVKISVIRLGARDKFPFFTFSLSLSLSIFVVNWEY